MKGELVVLFLAVIKVGLAIQCPQDQGDWKELVLHHEDCDKFYKCTSEGAVTMYCLDGLYFNPETSKCDWKQNVDCSKKSSTENNEIVSKEIDNTEIEDYDRENKSDDSESSEMKFLENGCPVNHNIHWLLPDENDCNIFYYCVRGEKIRKTCPSPLHFNFKLQVCDWPEVAGCEKSSEDNASEENASEENNSEDSGSTEDNSEVDTSEINTSEEDASEIDTSEVDTSEIDTKEDTSEVDTSETDTKEDTLEVDTSETDTTEDTSEVDTSETDTTEDTSEDNSQNDGKLLKKIEAAVNIKLLNLLL